MVICFSSRALRAFCWARPLVLFILSMVSFFGILVQRPIVSWRSRPKTFFQHLAAVWGTPLKTSFEGIGIRTSKLDITFDPILSFINSTDNTRIWHPNNVYTIYKYKNNNLHLNTQKYKDKKNNKIQKLCIVVYFF